MVSQRDFTISPCAERAIALGVKGERISPKVKVARATTVEPGMQQVVEGTSKRPGLVVFQPCAPLYDKHELVRTKGVAQVKLDKPFRLLVTIFAKYPVRIQKGQVVVEVLPHPRAALEIATTIGEVLGIEERQDEHFVNLTSPEANTQSQRENCSKELSKSKDPGEGRRIEPPLPDFEELDLSNVPDRLRERFRQMLRK